MITTRQLQDLETLLALLRDDAADREEHEARERMRFDVAFELAARGEAPAEADSTAALRGALRCVIDAAVHTTLVPRTEIARILREEAEGIYERQGKS